ncbi:MAG: hypothetical protein Q9191_001115 [Dirinaria sp. TL-2023a]
MDGLKFSTPSGIGEQLRENPKGSIPATLPAQMDQAFQNVDAVLKFAGCEGGWTRVYTMTSYHVGLDEDHKKEMLRCMKQWMPDHQPLWTMVGVERLAAEAYKVEVAVKAI